MELILMWKNPRMVVLTAVCAALYAAAMFPFKWATVFPGFAEVRPAAVLPILFSFMFGPAGAFGAAVGNVIGDIFGGMFGFGTPFGFVGNFLYGYIPYKMWQVFFKDKTVMGDIDLWRDRRPELLAKIGFLFVLLGSALLLLGAAMGTGLLQGNLTDSDLLKMLLGESVLSDWRYAAGITAGAFLAGAALLGYFTPWRILLVVTLASLACGLVIGLGVDIITKGALPMEVLSTWIVFNNVSLSLLLVPVLIPLMYPLAEQKGMLYQDLLEDLE